MPPEDHGPSVKDDKTYEALRDDGASKEKAARIANAKAGGENVSEKGGSAENYEDRTKEELEERAAELDIEGRSDMTKDDLIDAIRNH
jgi:Rho termination factor, N-terminal domain